MYLINENSDVGIVLEITFILTQKLLYLQKKIEPAGSYQSSQISTNTEIKRYFVRNFYTSL